MEQLRQKDEENRKLADRSKYKKQKNRSYLYIIIVTTNIYITFYEHNTDHKCFLPIQAMYK